MLDEKSDQEQTSSNIIQHDFFLIFFSFLNFESSQMHPTSNISSSAPILWFADQSSKPVEIEEEINIILAIKHMTRYSVEPRDRIFVKGYGFFSFAKIMGKYIGKNICKNLSDKYIQKPLVNAKKSATDAFKTSTERAIQKTAE